MTHFGSVLRHPSFDTATIKSPDLGLCEPLIFLWPFLWTLCIFGRLGTTPVTFKLH